MEEPIPSFILIIHQPSKAAKNLEVKEYYLTNTSLIPIIQLVPLATQEPSFLLLAKN